MSTDRIYQQGPITIPKAVREASGFNIGDPVVMEARDDEIMLRHPSGVLEFTAPACVGVPCEAVVGGQLAMRSAATNAR